MRVPSLGSHPTLWPLATGFCSGLHDFLDEEQNLQVASDPLDPLRKEVIQAADFRVTRVVAQSAKIAPELLKFRSERFAFRRGEGYDNNRITMKEQ